MNIINLTSTTSTNSYLKELPKEPALEEGTVVVADSQTAGRGQRGNVWESEPGKNITCSLLLYPTFLPVRRNFLLSEAVGLGVKKTLDAYTDEIFIKWPNDIYYRKQKIAGILIENELVGETYSRSIVGIGLNVNQEWFSSGIPNPVSLKQVTGRDWDKAILLERLVRAVLFWYERLKEGEMEMIRKEYHDALYRKTGFHRYEDKQGAFNARIGRVADDGCLHLTTETGEERSYAFKEVSFN